MISGSRALRRTLAGGVSLLAIAVATLAATLPSAEDIVAMEPVESSLLYDRYGALLYRFYDHEDRISVPIHKVSLHLIDAVIAIEDREFYSHHGFSVAGFVRALRNNLQSGALIEGGSTISQQLVKNRVLTADKTLSRKIKELILAFKLEFSLSKEEILELYLNQVAWGGTSYGAEAAALSYFGKTAEALTLSESAFLAGLLKAPSTYSPFKRGSAAYMHRRRVVLNRMFAEGLIDETQRLEALEERLVFAGARVSMEAPHFTHYVRRRLREHVSEEELRTRGLRIYSSLNLDLHRSAQEIVTQEVRSLFRHWVGNGAALITTPATGEILSMVGSVDYFDQQADGPVNATLSLRQPGSSIKPLTYAMSLARGKTAASMLSDKPIALTIPDEGNYSPRNIDYEFRGDISLRKALAASRNIPAVNELVSIGVPDFIEKAAALGINTWEDQNAYRYALTLGSGEVRMIDMAQAFSSFANLGYPVAPNPILRIEDKDGKRLYGRDCTTRRDGCFEKREFAPGVAYLINSILSDDQARASTFGHRSLLSIPGHEVAVKTGTTDLLRDNWAIGYTSDHLVAAWIGNNDGASMRFVHSGGRGASSIWNRIMRKILATKAPHVFPVPDDIVKVAFCGTVETGECAPCDTPSEEFFIAGSEPARQCIAHKSEHDQQKKGRLPETGFAMLAPL